jgi:hypothetical protein
MRLPRIILASTKGRIILLVLVGILAWHGWLWAAAPFKIAADMPTDGNRVDVVVTLAFVPDRFHVQELQRFGRVSGTRDNQVEVRSVNRANLHRLARPFWVEAVEPLQQGG